MNERHVYVMNRKTMFQREPKACQEAATPCWLLYGQASAHVDRSTLQLLSELSVFISGHLYLGCAYI